MATNDQKNVAPITRRHWCQNALKVSASLGLGTHNGSSLATQVEGLSLPVGAAKQLLIAASWRDAELSYQLGVIKATSNQVVAKVAIPSRAHQIMQLPSGVLIAIARRPGRWIAKWQVYKKPLSISWTEPNRALNGHVAISDDKKTLYTTETNLDDGTGVIGIRNAQSLKKRNELPTYGIDPHDLLITRQGIWVANGGIETSAETGRSKKIGQGFDSSLVLIDIESGALKARYAIGQSVTDKAFISIRHLARSGSFIGIGLQSEHPDLSNRDAAPIFAWLDQLHGQPTNSFLPQSAELSIDALNIGGYCGDVCATAQGFAFSATRVNQLVHWRSGAGVVAKQALLNVCALTKTGDWIFAAGEKKTLGVLNQSATTPDLIDYVFTNEQRYDNHWQAFKTV